MDETGIPDPALRKLDILVGEWDVRGRESGPEGEVCGKVSFEWMEGGFFLIQHVDLDHTGNKIKGIEYIGYDPLKRAITSYYFDNSGNTFEYVWELDNKYLTIWGGYIGSPSNFKSRFSDDLNSNTGRWVWPGGGFTSTMTRVSKERSATIQR